MVFSQTEQLSQHAISLNLKVSIFSQLTNCGSSSLKLLTQAIKTTSENMSLGTAITFYILHTHFHLSENPLHSFQCSDCQKQDCQSDFRCESYVCIFCIHVQCCLIRMVSDAAHFDWHKNPNNTYASLNTSHYMQTLQSDMTIHPTHIPTFQIPADYTKCNIFTPRLKQVEMSGIKWIMRN